MTGHTLNKKKYMAIYVLIGTSDFFGKTNLEYMILR